MSLGKQPRHDSDGAPAPRALARPYRTTWAEETFIDSDQAQNELSSDRPAFILRKDIMALIPSDIKRHIIHPDAIAQIRGFTDLFIFLNNDYNATSLRPLIETYFNDSTPLRGNLSQ
jgi:hypothetical protein